MNRSSRHPLSLVPTPVAVMGAALVAGAASSLLASCSPSLTGGMAGQAAGRATVVRVVDGDTLVVKAPPVRLPGQGQQDQQSQQSQQRTVRMLGIDAPELHPDGASEPACGAEAARAALEFRLPPGTTVRLVLDPRSDAVDRFGRTLAYVEVPHSAENTQSTQSTDINLELASAGMVGAWYPYGEVEPSRFTAYERAADAAHEAGRGSWAECEGLGR